MLIHNTFGVMLSVVFAMSQAFYSSFLVLAFLLLIENLDSNINVIHKNKESRQFEKESASSSNVARETSEPYGNADSFGRSSKG